jgi:hypothetical protein
VRFAVTVVRLDDHRLVGELRRAKEHAEELLQAARAIESCISGLTPGAPPNSVIEASLLVRAAALQVAAIVHGLVGRSERLALLACAASTQLEERRED